MMESKQQDDGLPGWAHIDFDQIEMGERIGGGGVGVIYKGYFNKQSVAVKTLFDARQGDELTKEYMDELLVMSQVKHSNIVTFLGASMVPPNLCFVMELCDNSLYNILHENREQFSDHDIIQMAVDIGSAMEYLHSLKPAIIHRDLKSHNVLRSSDDGRLKICDFGLVKCKNTLAGTPAYMAPELLENKPFNKSVDVYAFGILLNELFALEIPFFGLDINSIRTRAINEERPHMIKYKMQPKVIHLIEACWHHIPNKRPNFSSVVDDLLEIYDNLPEGKFTDAVDAHGSGDALDDLFK
jgi:serine/threonine protein kinase